MGKLHFSQNKKWFPIHKLNVQIAIKILINCFLIYSYGSNHTERTYENNFNTLGRNNRTPASPPAQFEASRMMGSRLSFQDNMHDVSPVSNYYSRCKNSHTFFFSIIFNLKKKIGNISSNIR